MQDTRDQDHPALPPPPDARDVTIAACRQIVAEMLDIPARPAMREQLRTLDEVLGGNCSFERIGMA